MILVIRGIEAVFKIICSPFLASCILQSPFVSTDRTRQYNPQLQLR